MRKIIVITVIILTWLAKPNPASAASTYQFLYQTLVNVAGDTYWDRLCPVDNTNGVQWNLCANWKQHAVAELGLGNITISSQGGFVYTTNAGQVFAQTVTKSDGTINWARFCPIDLQKGLDWTTCSPWAGVASDSIGLGNIKLSGSSGVVYTRNGSQVLSQLLENSDGLVSYNHDCPIDIQNGILWNQCTAWNTVSSSSIGLGNILISFQAAFVFTTPQGIQTMTQALNIQDGASGWVRSCPIDNITGIRWNQCSPWGQVPTSAIGLGNIKVSASNAQFFGTNQKLVFAWCENINNSTACGFNGLSWCAVGTTCSTGIVSGPQVQVSCAPNQKLVNSGNYCDYGNGTYSVTNMSVKYPIFGTHFLCLETAS